MNEPEKAIAAHDEALKLLKQTPATRIEVDNLNGLAAVYLRQQNLQQAETLLQRSISLSESANYLAGKAEALLTLSEQQNNLNHALAGQTAQQALGLWQTLSDKVGQARSHYQLGECYLAQSMLTEAGENYGTALRLWTELNDSLGQAGTLIALGFLEFRKGDWEKDISYLTQAQSLINEQAEPTKMRQIAGGLAEAFNETGMPEAASFISPDVGILPAIQ